MSDPIAHLAREILARNLQVHKGDSVIVESWNHTLPYTRAFVDEARRLGAQPTVLFEDETAWWSSVAAKTIAPFRHLSAVERSAVEKASAYVYLWGRPRCAKRST